MDVYRVTFIGHREIYGHCHLDDEIEKIVTDLIRKKEYVEFYVGRNGDFDVFAASAIKRAQKALGHHNSCLILLLPYRTKDDEYYASFYDEVTYYDGGRAHPKAAITLRNRQMIEYADLLVAYVEKDRKGGALTALKYAQSRGVKIINLSI